MDESSTHDLRLETVLQGVAQQLTELEQATQRIEVQLATYIYGEPEQMSSDCIADFQAVDLLRQSLTDLGQMMRVISGAVSCPITHDQQQTLLSGVKLSRSKAILSGIIADTTDEDDREFDWFL